MLLSDFITKCAKNKTYFRGLVVRAIEDAIVLLVAVIGIWLVCTVVSGLFRILGVS